MTSSLEPSIDAQDDVKAASAGLVSALEQRVARFASDAELDCLPTLAQLEHDALTAECRLVEESGGAREHPVQRVALSWADRLRRAGEVDAARGAEALASEIMILGIRERERLALGATPGHDAAGSAELFNALLAVEELRQRVEGRADRIGPAIEADAAAVCSEAGNVQTALRDALVERVDEDPPDRATRTVWAGRLIDLADEALVAANDVDPRAAARGLGEARRAIKWHLQRIEPGRTENARRLKRRRRRLEAEQVEQTLNHRLERRFGERAVKIWDRVVLVAILVVVGLLFVSFRGEPSGWVLFLDTAVCGFLLWDFFVKASMIGFHPAWLRRHVLTDFLPAIPFAWIATLDASRMTGRFAPLLKLLRVGQLARSLRLLGPLIRMFRAFSFLIRGLDRLVRRNAALLQNEVLLFPTPAERRMARARRASPEARLWRVRSEIDGYFETLLDEGDPDERARLGRHRADVLQATARVPVTLRDDLGDPRSARREATPMADDLLRKLSNVGSEEVEGRVGLDAVRRVARGARLIMRSPLRFAPVLGGLVPDDAVDLPDRRVASRTIRTISRSLEKWHDRVLWWADLRGTLTPGELVGRVGSSLVARTSRPAIRLLMIGGAYLILATGLELAGFDPNPQSRPDDLTRIGDFVWDAYDLMYSLTKAALITVGSICLAFLAVGVWFQRLARDTTTFHEQVARAQFLHLTDSVKARQRESDAALFAERIFRPERNLLEAEGAREAASRDEARFIRHLERFLAEGISPPSRADGFDPVARTVMLYRDLLDGALLTHTDTRATSQLLGNLAIQRMIEHAGRIDGVARKSLLKIDLERRRTFVRGPYLWFHAISRALSSRSAKLIVDYNAHAIPIVELDRTAPAERRRYEAWLAGTLGHEVQDEEGAGVRESARGKAPQLTTAFTVLHFLDDAPARDAEVATRFGDAVLAKLQRDRRALIRRVFGTYPLHKLPLESRILNVRRLYADWVEGGKILFAPLRFMALGAHVAMRGLVSLFHAVRAIRNPDRAFDDLADAEADFVAAARKVGRMREPGARAAIHLRAILDPEYLGLGLPFGLHDEREHDDRVRSPAMRDAAFVDAPAAFLDALSALEARAARCLRHLTRAAEDGLLERVGMKIDGTRLSDAPSLRALTILVMGDDDGLRSGLFGQEVFEEAVIDSLEFGLPEKSGLLPPFVWWWRFRRAWRDGLGETVMAAAARSGVIEAHGEGDPVREDQKLVKRAAWRSLRADTDGCRAAFEAICARRAGTLSQEAVEDRLSEALRHPGRVTEQLVTLRTVQTLTLVDVRNYRRHVWTLGHFEEEGDRGDVLLDLPAT